MFGTPTRYHVSCRVRSIGQEFDTTPNEHAGVVIETNGTAWAAFCAWLLDKDSWLRTTPEGIKSLMQSMDTPAASGRSQLEVFGWDCEEHTNTFANDWETSDIQVDEVNHTVRMTGTACCSSFEFEVVVKPVKCPVVVGQTLPNGATVIDAKQTKAGRWFVLAAWQRGADMLRPISEYIVWELDPETLACDNGKYRITVTEAAKVFDAIGVSSEETANVVVGG